MIVALDSTVLIDVLRGRIPTLRLLAEMTNRGEQLATSSMNIAEVYAGLRQGEEEETTAFLDGLLTFPVTFAIARNAGLIKMRFARKGRTVSLDDMIVAATAMEHDLVLLTGNRKDFDGIDGLHLFPEF
ncbi:MAG TPA: type II toxin-antitoxin system VapC family toxin [Acidobacteriaceae bacterium]